MEKVIRKFSDTITSKFLRIIKEKMEFTFLTETFIVTLQTCSEIRRLKNIRDVRYYKSGDHQYKRIAQSNGLFINYKNKKVNKIVCSAT